MPQDVVSTGEVSYESVVHPLSTIRACAGCEYNVDLSQSGPEVACSHPTMLEQARAVNPAVGAVGSVMVRRRKRCSY